MLAPFVDRPVIDGTGLKGTFQVTLDIPFEAMLRMIQNQGGNPALRGGFAGFPGGAPGAGNPGAASDPAPSSIFQAVQQLGLKLQSRAVA
jgi:uncharacterized protein (TIGR03435 family)